MRCEHDGDRIAHDIKAQLALHGTGGTLEPADVHALAGALDDIVDHAEEAADQLGLYAIEAPIEAAQRMTEILVDCGAQVAGALHGLATGQDLGAHLVALHELEQLGDQVMRAAVAALFVDGVDPMTVIRWKAIVETLEAAVDDCERVADVLEGMMLKARPAPPARGLDLSPRRTRARRTAPRPAPSPRGGGGSTSPPSAGRSTPPGRPAPPRRRPARPRRARSRPRAARLPLLVLRAAALGRPGRRRRGGRLARLRPLGLALELRALLAHAHVLGPAADVGVQRAVLHGDRARADRVEQRAVVGDQQQRAGERLQRGLERLAALEVEVVGRLVEDQHVRARVDEHGEREAAALAAGQAVERLLGLLAAEQELAEQRARLVRLEARRALAGLEHRRAAPAGPASRPRAPRRAGRAARA